MVATLRILKETDLHHQALQRGSILNCSLLYYSVFLSALTRQPRRFSLSTTKIINLAQTALPSYRLPRNSSSEAERGLYNLSLALTYNIVSCVIKHEIIVKKNNIIKKSGTHAGRSPRISRSATWRRYHNYRCRRGRLRRSHYKQVCYLLFQSCDSGTVGIYLVSSSGRDVVV